MIVLLRKRKIKWNLTLKIFISSNIFRTWISGIINTLLEIKLENSKDQPVINVPNPSQPQPQNEAAQRKRDSQT